jgi:hypothetical protein
MSTFNATKVAAFISSQTYTQYDYQVRGLVATHFGITLITAARWVERVTQAGMVRASGKVALSVA